MLLNCIASITTRLLNRHNALQAAVKEMQRVLSAMTSSANSSCEGHELLKSSVIQAISLAVSIILRDSTRLTETTSLRTSAGSLSAVVCHPYSREALVRTPSLAKVCRSVHLCQYCLCMTASRSMQLPLSAWFVELLDVVQTKLFVHVMRRKMVVFFPKPPNDFATKSLMLQVNMAFSRGQVQDLLTLRQLFYARTGQLSLERHVLMSKMSRHSQQALNVKTWAKRLQENSEEEQQMALLMLTATCFGVRLLQARQAA